MTKRAPLTKCHHDHIELPDLHAPLLPYSLDLDPAWQRATWQQRLLMVTTVALAGTIGGAVLAAMWLFADRVPWPVW
jgi:hypothetical protein